MCPSHLLAAFLPQALEAPIAGLWTNWQKLPLSDVVTQNGPAISSRGNGKFDVFVLGTDKNSHIIATPGRRPPG